MKSTVIYIVGFSEVLQYIFIYFQCALDTSYWTPLNHLGIWGSIILYFCVMLVFYAPTIGYAYQGTAFEVFSSGSFWLTLIVTNVILLVPIVAYRFYTSNIKATLSDRVRMKQRLTKSKSRSREFRVRRTSTFRRSQRSMRSGYAFAHQGGFGELITSGLNMRDRASSAQLRAPVTLTRVKKVDVDSIHVPSNGKVADASHPNSVENEGSAEKIVYSVKL